MSVDIVIVKVCLESEIAQSRLAYELVCRDCLDN